MDPLAIRKLGPVVAIDGPAGTGKSSVTKKLCERLGYVHIDTGALYRAVALECISHHIDFTHELSDKEREEASEIARRAHFEFKRDPKKNPANRLWMNGVDVSERIRTPEVSMAASKGSAVPGVRAALLGLQRRLGCSGKAILEGRDIGTVVFPDADVKFFLTASVEERTKRRLMELDALGADVPTYEELREQIIRRDEGDSTRAIAPLKRAEDAIELDTTYLTLDQVVEKMESHVRQRVNEK